jgi:hypothetical protein
MLTENRSVKQEPGGQRRWFEDELIVWYRASGEIEGFQLCYDQSGCREALTWRPGAGLARSRIDGGDHSPLKNETPVLTADGRKPWAQVPALFRARSATLEPPLRDLVLSRLEGGK